MQININDTVKVKLSDYGRLIWMNAHAESRMMTRKTSVLEPPKEDEDGYYVAQMWMIMEIFGPYTGLGKQPTFVGPIVVESPRKATS